MVTIEEYIDELKNVDFCRNVGTRSEVPNAIYAADWDEAVAWSYGREWTHFQSLRDNEFWELAHWEDRFTSESEFEAECDRFRDTYRDYIYSIVNDKTKDLNVASSHLDEIQRNIRGCIYGGLEEIAFHDVTDASFYMLAAGCVFKGHYPCGYEGDYPDGQIVIY